MPAPSKDRRPTGSGLNRLSRPEAKALDRAVAAGDAGTMATDAALTLVERGLATLRDGRLFATIEGRSRAIRDAGGTTAFLEQHRRLERRAMSTDCGMEDLLVDLDESPLAWLARRKGRDGKPLLAPAEVAAGERLRADFTRAQMTPRITANWESAVSSGRRGGGAAGLELAEAVVAAKARFSRALEAVGPELSGALVDVCCFLKGLEDVERERAWPARGAKLVLGLGLARLARHYGLVVDGPSKSLGIVSWGAPGSRPTIDGV